MDKICMLYMPAFYRSFGKQALKMAERSLDDIILSGKFSGVYLIGLWESGGYDGGFDVVEYSVDGRFGTNRQLNELIERAHYFGLKVGVDVVPNHVSDLHFLAQNCLNGVPGYEDCLYVVSEAEAKRLTEAGVPNFFGKLAYSNFGDKYVRSTFCDYRQLNLNWQSQKVKKYFRGVFADLKSIGVDFARIDCGMMLLEDVSKADKNNPMACFNPLASIEAVRKVAGGMQLFFEWFDPESAYLFDNMPECYALDCSYVLTGKLNLDWDRYGSKLIPLFGGHDQMTLSDRGIELKEALSLALLVSHGGREYVFLDIQTLLGWRTDPTILPEDYEYDADINNPNQRYRARRPIAPVLEKFNEEVMKQFSKKE